MSANSAWPMVNVMEVLKDVTRGHQRIPKANYQEYGETPVVDQSIDAIAGYTDENSSLTDPPYIIFGDHTRVIKYLDEPFLPGGQGVRIFKADTSVDDRFLFHYLSANKVQDLGYSRHFKLFKELEVPFPSLAEQRRIAKILDQSYSQLHDSRQLLSSLDSGRSELLAALLKQEDYPTAVLGEVAKINPRLSRTPDDGATVTFLPMAEVHENGSIGAGERRKYREVKRGYTKFENEDILVAKITPCFQNKKIAQATIPTDFGVGSTEFHVVRPGENTDARYLTDLLRQDKLVLEGEKFMTGSGGQRRVPPWFFQEMSIPFPPIEEQQHIGELLGTVVDLQTMVSQKITALEELHASLSARAFAGKL